MIILRMNKKANAERNGPRIPIATFAVAGSKSIITKLLINVSVALRISEFLWLMVSMTFCPQKGLSDRSAFDGWSSILRGETPRKQHTLLLKPLKFRLILLLAGNLKSAKCRIRTNNGRHRHKSCTHHRRGRSISSDGCHLLGFRGGMKLEAGVSLRQPQRRGRIGR